MQDIRNTDCIEMMRGFNDKTFDLAITSPPYNMNLRVNHRGDGYCSRQVVKELSTKYVGYDDNIPMDEYERFLDVVIYELLRVAKVSFFNIQMITGNKPALFRLMGKYASHIKEVAIWDKGSTQPAIGEGVMNSRFVFVLILGGRPITRAFKGANFSRGTLDNLWTIKKKQSAIDDHGASFPVEFAEHIIRNFCPAGGVVLDPFLGTGTTAIAAYRCGCSFTGSEINAAYYASAKVRIQNETSQTLLFT